MTAVFTLASLFWLNSAFAETYALKNCSQLQSSNAVLLVHASWCPHCQNFLPVYNEVSNLPEMQNYKFYVRRNDKGAPVCGKAIDGVPVVFTNNMKHSNAGEMSKSGLIKFITG